MPGRRRRLRPGLLDLYLIRGAAGPFLIVVLMVAAAMMLERALRLIHELAGKGADLSYFFPILGQLLPYYLDLAIPAAFMVALVLLVARLDARLELEAMLASGLSLARIAAPLAALGLVIGAAGLVTGGWLEPLGRYGLRSLRAEAINAGRIGRLQPRAIYHPSETLALTFDARAAGDRVDGIFVWQRLPDGRELVLTGRSGRIGFASRRGYFAIQLDRGLYVAEGRNGADHFSFNDMLFREPLQLRESEWRRGWDQKEMTLPELAAALDGGAANIPRRAIEAELYGRIARAALIPLIPFIVLPLTVTTKKGRRALGIAIAAVLLAGLHHAMNLVKQLSLLGTVESGPAVLAAGALGASLVALVFVSGRHLPSHSPIHSFLKPFTTVLSRLGAGSTRRPPQRRGRILAAYLGWELAKWTLLALLAILLLLQMFDLLDRGEEFVARGLGLADIGYYVWLQLPLMLQQAVPLAALAAAMVVFVDLGRSSEITAVRAAGISQWRVLLMALPVPLLLSLAAFGLSEYAGPRSQLTLASWWSQSDPPAATARAEARWFRVGDEIVQARSASSDGRRLSGVRIFRRDDQGLLAERLTASAATAESGGWTLHDVERSRYGGGVLQRDRFGRLSWNARLLPADVAAFFSSVRAQSSAAARRALGDAAPVSQSQTMFATRVLRLAAEPLAPIVMLLLALPLAFVAPRTGVAWPAFLYAAGGGLLYLVADGVLTVFAQLGYLPAAVGAWAAPAIVLLGGVTVLLYAER